MSATPAPRECPRTPHLQSRLHDTRSRGAPSARALTCQGPQRRRRCPPRTVEARAARTSRRCRAIRGVGSSGGRMSCHGSARRAACAVRRAALIALEPSILSIGTRRPYPVGPAIYIMIK
eukprot:scaffold70724_cov29-Tisochrysis_lutea.AAC.1